MDTPEIVEQIKQRGKEAAAESLRHVEEWGQAMMTTNGLRLVQHDPAKRPTFRQGTAKAPPCAIGETSEHTLEPEADTPITLDAP